MATVDVPGADEALSPHDARYDQPPDGQFEAEPAFDVEATSARLPRRRSPLVLGVFGVLLIVVMSPLAALGFYQYEYHDRIFPGVSALGADLSGLTLAEAEEVVAARATEMTARPVLVWAAGREWPTDWARLGLHLPARPIAQRAFLVGREGNPLEQFRAQLGALRAGVAVASREGLDEAVLRRFVQAAAAEVDQPMRNARLDLLPDLTFKLTSAQEGRQLEVDEALVRMRASVESGVDTVGLPVTITPPVTTDEMRLPIKAKAEKILSGPLTLSFEEKRWTLERQDLADLLVFSGGPGVPLDVAVDLESLRPRIEKIGSELNQEPREGAIEWANGAARTTRQSQDGRALDVDAALKLVSERTVAGDRTVTLPVSVVKPRIDTRRVPDLGIRELIDSGTTSFAGSLPQKAHNIKLAASRLNGTIVAPHELFSFNKALGPTTLDNGYQVAFGIMSTGGANHRTVPSVAGGICQVATTLFQPMFWSGYQLEERHWHLYWIPAYASRGVVGLDATVDEEVGLDLQFVNNTDSYLLIQARTDDSSVTFELYGTKPNWDVKVDGPKVTDRRPADPTPVTEREPSLPNGQKIQVEAAREGFTASFVRAVTGRDGNVRTLNLESKYVPSRNVTLVGTGGSGGSQTAPQNVPQAAPLNAPRSGGA
ncbi:MAG: VanW family protein [Chloroflexi bacterium]|nr:VanW family protein [Chloroflexota bacterium]